MSQRKVIESLIISCTDGVAVLYVCIYISRSLIQGRTLLPQSSHTALWSNTYTYTSIWQRNQFDVQASIQTQKLLLLPDYFDHCGNTEIDYRQLKRPLLISTERIPTKEGRSAMLKGAWESAQNCENSRRKRGMLKQVLGRLQQWEKRQLVR